MLNYPFNKLLIRPSSAGLTSVVVTRFLFLLLDFLVKMWLWNACLRLIFPVPVNLNLFFAPEFVFCFGIVQNRLSIKKVNWGAKLRIITNFSKFSLKYIVDFPIATVLHLP